MLYIENTILFFYRFLFFLSTTKLQENNFMSRLFSASLCALFVFSMTTVDASAADAKAGAAVYKSSCESCHKMGIMGAPKVGAENKADWAARVKTGMPTLVSHSVKGYTGKKGMMPAKGGNAKLTDVQIANAVEYMVQSSK